MPVVRLTLGAMLCCALLIGGCRTTPSECPIATVRVDPAVIPNGESETSVFVHVDNPSPNNGLEPVTRLTALSGTFADPFALETVYACAFDVTGEVEICAEATYIDPDAPPAGDSSDGLIQTAVEGVGALAQYIGQPHVRLPNPIECSETRCTVVECPVEKNLCPDVSSLTLDPDRPAEGQTVSVTVVANDPDDNPDPLTTTLTARHGTIADPNATMTTYDCDPDIGGYIPICVEASDGACTETLCDGVLCPGEPLENTCPIVESMSANPNPIPPPNDTTNVEVMAWDPDEFPEDLMVEWTSEGGGFADRNATETTFRCTQPGRVEICVQANDGDDDCLDDELTRQCMTVECPGNVRPNFCPNLNVINPIPRIIPDGSNFTAVETRGWDTDEKPFPLVLTLSALWGTFQNTENLRCEANDPDCFQSENVVYQDAIYICDRPGQVELCVEATDGECLKTLCTDVFCPDDVPTLP